MRERCPICADTGVIRDPKTGCVCPCLHCNKKPTQPRTDKPDGTRKPRLG